MRKPIVRAVLVASSLTFVGTAALAHHNGHESRTVAECEKLPGTRTSGERGACIACVTRNGGNHFHYHPDYAAGNRCRPNDGRP